MFRIVQGPPGAGKTYYAVNYLKKFTEYDKLYNVMNLDSEVLLVTNIDEIKVYHLTIEEFRTQGLIDPAKLKEYMRKNNYKRVIYIHDEAQRVYGGMKDNAEFFFFEYSRHLGLDVFLIVQTVSALPRRLTEICEYVIEAKPRTIAMIGFHYDMKDPKTGGKLGSIVVKKDQNVFKLYKSFDVDEIEKPKKVVLRKLVIGGVIIALSFGSVTFLLKYAFNVQTQQKAVGAKQESKGLIELPKPTGKPKGMEGLKVTGNKVAKGSITDRPFYIFDEGERAPRVKPHGDLKGTAVTDKGVFYFYEKL